MLKKIILVSLFVSIFLGCAYSSETVPPEYPDQTHQDKTPTPSPAPTGTPTLLPQVRISTADDLLFAGNYQAAIPEYEKAFQTASEKEIQAAALKGLSLSYLKMDICSSALTFLTTIREQHQQSSVTADAYFLSGRCYETLLQYDSAIDAYQMYLVQQPDLLPSFVHEKIGDLYVLQSNQPEAIRHYSLALNHADSAWQDSLRIKIARAYQDLSDFSSAISILWEVFNLTSSDYTKATVNLYLGQMYLAIEEAEQAYARYLDSVLNFPRSYDSYTQLVELVNRGVSVPDLNRGIVDYYAGQYGYAIDALTRYINQTADHAGEAHFFLGISYLYIADYDNALNQYDLLIQDHPEDRFWISAWDEKAYLLWNIKNLHEQAAQVLLDFVALVPESSDSPGFLFEAGRIYERGGFLDKAAATWERLLDEYPQSDRSLRGLFLAGISHFRLLDYQTSLTDFQRYILLTDNPDEQSAAHFWMGKNYSAQNDPTAALNSWRLAQSLDPTGYYGIRSGQLITQKNAFENSVSINPIIDIGAERAQAEYWLKQTFGLPENINLADLSILETHSSFQKAQQYYSLGMYTQASEEFSTLSQTIAFDVSLSYILMNHLLDLQLYRQAIILCRQILDLVFTTDQATFSAPIYFNHVRYGLYYNDLVDTSAQNYGFDPLLIYSLIRQESLFEGHAVSSAGAVGLMQIMPATGVEIAGYLNWPAGFSITDLERPVINIPMGVSYLARQRDYFNSDLVMALAAYNGGPGNALAWQALSNNDPDLFVEVIRFDETRQYIMQITEFFWTYQQLYAKQ